MLVSYSLGEWSFTGVVNLLWPMRHFFVSFNEPLKKFNNKKCLEITYLWQPSKKKEKICFSMRLILSSIVLSINLNSNVVVSLLFTESGSYLIFHPSFLIGFYFWLNEKKKCFYASIYEYLYVLPKVILYYLMFVSDSEIKLSRDFTSQHHLE